MLQTTLPTHSKSLYRIAAVMAILIALAGLVDALTSMGIEGRDNSTVAVTEWFALFQTDPFEAFSLLGVINLVTLSLGIPVYLALHLAFQRNQPVLAVLAPVLFCIGTVVYLSSNTVLPLFAVSRQYAAADPAQKPVLEAAGRALLAQGADLTAGTFIGLFFTQLAGVLVAAAMLRSRDFSPWAGRVGLAGFSLMIVFFVLTAFFPHHYDTAMLVAAPGGLLLMAYQILLARRFVQLGK